MQWALLHTSTHSLSHPTYSRLVGESQRSYKSTTYTQFRVGKVYWQEKGEKFIQLDLNSVKFCTIFND